MEVVACYLDWISTSFQLLVICWFIELFSIWIPANIWCRQTYRDLEPNYPVYPTTATSYCIYISDHSPHHSTAPWAAPFVWGQQSPCGNIPSILLSRHLFGYRGMWHRSWYRLNPLSYYPSFPWFLDKWQISLHAYIVLYFPLRNKREIITLCKWFSFNVKSILNIEHFG